MALLQPPSRDTVPLITIKIFYSILYTKNNVATFVQAMWSPYAFHPFPFAPGRQVIPGEAQIPRNISSLLL
jgi:hypothetical protein